MDNQIHQRFLTSVLGEDGFRALEKAAARVPALMDVLLPRTILAWAQTAIKMDYDGFVPGTASNFVVAKSEKGMYSGSLGNYSFEGESLFHVVASVALALGVEPEVSEVPGDALQKLGKSIDLVVTSRAGVKERLLQKKILDNENAGYKFSHVHEGPAALGGPQYTTVNAHSPSGEHIGYAKFLHHPDGKSMSAFGVGVDDDHQRKGIASHMYSMAQKLTSKAVVPSKIQTDEGAALWSGNAKQAQFGKNQAASSGPQKQSFSVQLKDGRTANLAVHHTPAWGTIKIDENTTIPYHDGSTLVRATAPDGTHIGNASFAHDGKGGMSSSKTYSHEDWRRQGLATHMYDIAQKVAGMTIEPTKALLEDGASFWADRNSKLGKTDLPGQSAKAIPAASGAVS